MSPIILTESHSQEFKRDYRTSLYVALDVSGKSRAWNAYNLRIIFVNPKHCSYTITYMGKVVNKFALQACDFPHTFNASLMGT